MRKILLSVLLMSLTSCERPEYEPDPQSTASPGSSNRINSAPASNLVEPSSGQGLRETFSFHLSDPDGAADIEWAQMLLNDSLKGERGCYLHWEVMAKVLYLQNDSANALIGPIAIGRGGKLSNEQCTVDVSKVTVEAESTEVSLRVPIEFKPGFRGEKKIFLRIQDLAGMMTEWKQQGSWTVP